jgi:N-acetylmuramoyl-L-alanine amidase
MRRALVPIVAALLLLALPATPASAVLGSVTLSASASKIVVGDTVTLSGTISPAAAGQTVEIHDEIDAIIATATTDAAGAFAVDLTPTGTAAYRSVWAGVASEPVTVAVRASVSVRLPPVRLFDQVEVNGRVRPAVVGEALVTLSVGGEVVATRHARLGSGGGFSVAFTIEQPGRYRARATFSDADHLPGRAVSAPRTTPLPSLHEGSSGVFVELLEQRLVSLHYRLEGINRRYDFRTGDAVVAFRKVQGMSRVFTVDAAVWRALADPIVPRARSRDDGFHIEVNQTLQVLYTVQDGQITNILHISSGKPSTPTYDGTFHVNRKIAGYSPNHLYYPSYFDGNRALHGWTDVPTYPASHGCVRIPYWNAKFIYRLAKIGTPVIVYHHS